MVREQGGPDENRLRVAAAYLTSSTPQRRRSSTIPKTDRSERLMFKAEEINIVEWRPETLALLLDVRLAGRRGNVDIEYVLVGSDIVPGWRDRPPSVRPSDLVRVYVKNLGDAPASCVVDIEYREVRT